MDEETKPTSLAALHGLLKDKTNGARLSIEDINDAIAEAGAAAGAGEYDEFLRRKVEIARVSKRAGIGIPQEEVEAEAAIRRAELLRRTDEAGL